MSKTRSPFPTGSDDSISGDVCVSSVALNTAQLASHGPTVGTEEQAALMISQSWEEPLFTTVKYSKSYRVPSCASLKLHTLLHVLPCHVHSTVSHLTICKMASVIRKY